MKIFINNRNLLTWPKAMAEKLSKENHEVIFIDNDSTYPPLLDWYSVCGYECIKVANLGNRSIWLMDLAQKQREPYVFTDPDHDLSEVPSDWAEVLAEGLKQFPNHNKFGLSWDESRVPPENPAYFMDKFDKYPEGLPYLWEDVRLPGNWHGYANDSTFAVYRPETPAEISGIRKGRPYTGLHLPWHLTLEPTKTPGKLSVPFDEEVYYYFKTCENSSHTIGRMIESGMLREYEIRTNRTISYRFSWSWI
jgi:hypothetical protein